MVCAALIFAILFAAGASRATSVVYDIAGDGSSIPSDQTGSFDGVSATAPFAPGSSITLEFDANGDGVLGDVTVVTSRLITHSVYDTPDFGPFAKDSIGVIQGGLGTLASIGPYTYIHWTTDATYSVSGTISPDGFPPNPLVASGSRLTARLGVAHPFQPEPPHDSMVRPVHCRVHRGIRDRRESIRPDGDGRTAW